MKQLSIITINFNDKVGLQRTFDSVFSQTWQNFEYIVIDGGSTDGSAELINNYKEKFSFWISEPDRGIYHAINKGLAQASGEYVLVLNSGDCLSSATTLEKVTPFLAGEDIIYGNSFDVNFPDGRKDFLRTYPDKLSFLFLFNSALRHQATFIKRSLHEKIGFYDESYKIVSDWILMIRAFCETGTVYKYINLTVCHYDRRGISSSNLNLNKEERNRFLNEKFSFFVDDYEKFKDVLVFDPGMSIKLTNYRKIKQLIKYLLPYGLVRLIQKMKHK